MSKGVSMRSEDISPEYEEAEAKYAEAIEPYFLGVFDVEDEYYSKVVGDDADYFFDKTDFSFVIHNDDLEWLLDDFVSVMMGETKYACAYQQILNLENPHVVVRYTCGDVDDENTRTSVVKRGKKCHLETPIASEFLGDDLYRTSFHHIATALHEVGHAMNECNSSSENILPSLWEGVEIESLFVEELFYLYLSQCAERVANGLTSHYQDSSITKENIEYWVKNARVANHVDLFARTAYAIMPDVEPDFDDKPFVARYVVGEVYSKCLLEEYKKNPEMTMNTFYSFVKSNANISHFDEIAEALFPDLIKEERIACSAEQRLARSPHDVVVKKYAGIVENEIQKLTTKSSSSDQNE